MRMAEMLCGSGLGASMRQFRWLWRSMNASTPGEKWEAENYLLWWGCAMQRLLRPSIPDSLQRRVLLRLLCLWIAGPM